MTDPIKRPSSLYKPGQSGNLSGRPKMTAEEVLMKETFRSALAAMGTKTMAEIEAIAKDPNSPAAYAIQAKAISWFWKKGNPTYYKEFLDRTLGKVAQPIELEQRPYAKETDEEIDRRIKIFEGGEALSTREEE